MYITPEQVIAHFDNKELPRIDKDTIDNNKINMITDRVNNVINSYFLTAGITNPDQSAIDFAKYIGLDLFAFYAADRVIEGVQKKYDEAMSQLKQVASGKLRLGEQASGSENEPGKQKKVGMFNVKLTRV
jgi:phage gp36-like protein